MSISPNPTSYSEVQPWGTTHYEIEPRSYIHFQTEHQLVEIFTNPYFGRMLFLDGVLQSAARDEHLYHKTLVGAGLYNGRNLGKVLIAGGAEGSVAREALSLGAERVQMIDWDLELVRHIREVEGWNSRVWTDPKFHYSSKDIRMFCHDTIQTFDTIFIDLLDINTDEDFAFTKELLLTLGSVREFDGSVVVMNVGRHRHYAENLLEGSEDALMEINVPSFQEPTFLVRKVYSKIP